VDTILPGDTSQSSLVVRETLLLQPIITSVSQGGVTCDSLGDVTWSHGTHDVRDLSGKSYGSRMRKQHQKGQKRIVMSFMSTREFLLLLFRLNGRDAGVR